MYFSSKDITKEMCDLSITFKIIDKNFNIYMSWKPVIENTIFDTNIDFTRRVYWVLNSHKTPDPLFSTYAGFVSIENVQIPLRYITLSGIVVCTEDIINACIQAPLSYNHYI